MDTRHVTVTIMPGSIITVIACVVFLVVLYFLRDTVLVILAAVVIASAIEPVTRYLMQYKVPRVISVLMVYVVILGTLFSIFYFLMPPLFKETAGFVATVPSYFDAVAQSGPGHNVALPIVSGGSISFLDSLQDLRQTFTGTSEGLFNSISAVFGGVLSFVLVVVLSFYFAVQDRGIDDFLKLITPSKHQGYVLDLWRRSEIKIGRWMQGQILLSLISGIMVYLILTILQVPYAILLALLAGIFELIPVFGSILAAVPAVAVAFIDGGTGLALLVIGAYIIINQFQGNLIYPLVVQKIVGVPPLLVILSLIIGGQLAGFMGILLSVPVAAVLREFVTDIQRERLKRNNEQKVAAVP